jgi:excisionase family DNA binding protein
VLEQLLIGKKDAARVLGVSLRTVENLIAQKELETRRIGRRRLIPRKSLEKLARRDVYIPANQPTEVQEPQSDR